MKLKYAGPKACVTYHGISFLSGKDDKFSFLNTLVNLLDAIDSPHIEGKVYTITLTTQTHDEDYLYRTIEKYVPDLQERIDAQLKIREEEIEHELYHAQKNKFLDEDAKEAYIENIHLMKEYSLQRTYNKAVYYAGIYALADLLEKDHIDAIDAPLIHHIAHIFQTVKGILENRKTPIDTKIDMYVKESQMHIRLQVINIGTIKL